MHHLHLHFRIRTPMPSSTKFLACQFRLSELLMDAPQNEVAKWLITTCGIPAEKAVALSNKLDAECWISTVSALQQMIASDGSFLDVLGCPKPIQLVIRTNINAHNKKSLDKLSTIEVEHLLNNLFPEERYGTTYRARKITGTVLNVTESPEKLMQWGITSAIHAEAVWISLSKWKSAGVPLDQLEGAQENASTENISDESTDHVRCLIPCPCVSVTGS